MAVEKKKVPARAATKTTTRTSSASKTTAMASQKPDMMRSMLMWLGFALAVILLNLGLTMAFTSKSISPAIDEDQYQHVTLTDKTEYYGKLEVVNDSTLRLKRPLSLQRVEAQKGASFAFVEVGANLDFEAEMIIPTSKVVSFNNIKENSTLEKKLKSATSK